MFGGLGSGNGLSKRVLGSEGFLGEAPCVEDRVANEVRDLAVILESAGLHGEVHGSGSGVLCRRGAGDDLELIDGVDAYGLGDEPVVALLADGLGREAIEIELAEVVARTANDGKAGSALRTGSEAPNAVGSRCALFICSGRLE